MDFILKIVTGQEAFDLLNDDNFITSWSRLASMCEKVTVIQEHPFVSTWYNQYRDKYEPVICIARANSGRLIGIMPVAMTVEKGLLTIAGDWQAEYHGWICDPQIEDEFPVACLIEIKHRFKPQVWRWRWLPPGTSTDWLFSSKLEREGIYVRYRKQHSPVWDLRDEEKLNKHLRNKTVLNEINRYRRRGAFRFERVRDKSKTRELIEVLRLQNDFRHEMMHQTMPFTNDSNKAAYYVERQNHPEAVHFSVLWLNDEPLAFHFGACDRSALYLGLTSFDPRENKNSPGTLLLLELAKMLREEGYTHIDLTPGMDSYKERFANSNQLVLEPTFYFTKKTKIIADLRSKLRSACKQILSSLGIDKDRLRRMYDNVIDISDRIRRISPRRLFSSLSRVIYCRRVYVYYRLTRDESFILTENDPMIHVQKYEDLFGYTGSKSLLSRRSLFAEAFKRFGRNETLYTINIDSVLAHYGWMTKGGKLHHFTSVDMTFQSPENSMILYDFYTDPAFRRRGFYLRNLKQMISDSFKAGATEVFIGVEPENTASRRAVETVGFTPFRTFSNVRCLWYRRKREYET